MNISAIESAIRRICDEIYTHSLQSWWLSASESDLLFELVACILGSQVHYEVALAAAEKIRNVGLLENPTEQYGFSDYEMAVYNILKQPLHAPCWPPAGRSYRFAKIRANHITRTLWAVYLNGDSLHGILHNCKTAREARRSVVTVGVGIGPKQASLFLRNIGFTDELAILDIHLLRFMNLLGLIDRTIRTVSSIRKYEIMEKHLLNYAKRVGYSLGCVDQAIWIVMRVYLQEARA